MLANNKLLDVLSAKRDQIMATIRDQVNVEMKGFGVAIEDVRIRRADLPDENTKAILSRMQSERQRVAAQARAEGAEASARIRADAERDRTVLLAEARATLGPAARRGRGGGHPHLRQGVSSRMSASTPSGAPCRPIGRRSRPATLAWFLPRTTNSCAIFSRCRCRAGNRPVASRRAPDHMRHSPPGKARPCA